MTPRSADSFVKEVEEQAAKSLANHQVCEDVAVTKAEGWWVLARRHPDGELDSAYRVQICVLRGGTLLIHGDVGPVLFGRCPARTREAVVEWIATANSDYYAQKAAIGMRRAVTTREPEVALYEIEDRIEDLRDGSDSNLLRLSEREQRMVGMWEEARCMIREKDDLAVVDEFIYSRTGDPEDLVQGEVIDSQVVWCHCLVKKLYDLLQEKEKRDERTE